MAKKKTTQNKCSKAAIKLNCEKKKGSIKKCIKEKLNTCNRSNLNYRSNFQKQIVKINAGKQTKTGASGGGGGVSSLPYVPPKSASQNIVGGTRKNDQPLENKIDKLSKVVKDLYESNKVLSKTVKSEKTADKKLEETVTSLITEPDKLTKTAMGELTDSTKPIYGETDKKAGKMLIGELTSSKKPQIGLKTPPDLIIHSPRPSDLIPPNVTRPAINSASKQLASLPQPIVPRLYNTNTASKSLSTVNANFNSSPASIPPEPSFSRPKVDRHSGLPRPSIYNTNTASKTINLYNSNSTKSPSYISSISNISNNFPFSINSEKENALRNSQSDNFKSTASYNPVTFKAESDDSTEKEIKVMNLSEIENDFNNEIEQQFEELNKLNPNRNTIDYSAMYEDDDEWNF
jgi:hypothetical protein